MSYASDVDCGPEDGAEKNFDQETDGLRMNATSSQQLDLLQRATSRIHGNEGEDASGQQRQATVMIGPPGQITFVDSVNLPSGCELGTM